jgi:membrane-associated phospholipid phosphatase
LSANHRHAGCAVALVLAIACAPARAEPVAARGAAAASAPSPAPWDGLGEDVADAFTGYNLLFYGGAVALTGAMAFGGADHAIRVGVQRSLASPAFGDGVYYTGYVLPAVLAPATYLAGLVGGDHDMTAAGSAALQALGVTLLATGVLKIAVGRPYPLNGGDPNAPDRLDHPEYARQFRPFGSFWPLPAWPSGHTSATTAIAAALTAYYPEHPWIPLVGYPVALAIGFGLVDGDRHWTSDVVSGALVGHAIGYSIGGSFRRRARAGNADDAERLQLAPMLGRGLFGAALGRAW